MGSYVVSGVLTVAEYFAGIGLVRMGLERAGWKVVFANDISSRKYDMYRGFFPKSHKHYRISDIYDIPQREIPGTTLATCSFPCVDLSLAGNMQGMVGSKHSSAFWGFVNILKVQGDQAPPLIMVENVPGWLHSNKGEDFRLTVQALNDLGYHCDVFTLDALRFVPQSRLRVFLIGRKMENSTQSDCTGILTRSTALLPNSLRKSVISNSDLLWFSGVVPEPPALKADGLAEIVEQLDNADPRWWSQEEVDRHLAMMEQSHHDRVMKLAQDEQTHYRTFYRRVRGDKQRAEVRPDEIAGCLRTAVGGSGKQFLIQAGSSSVRMRTMTAREYARLQGVPDRYSLAVNGVHALTAFGDAVCVPAVAWIAENVLNPLVETLESSWQIILQPQTV